MYLVSWSKTIHFIKILLKRQDDISHLIRFGGDWLAYHEIPATLEQRINVIRTYKSQVIFVYQYVSHFVWCRNICHDIELEIVV